jgi:Cupin domain
MQKTNENVMFKSRFTNAREISNGKLSEGFLSLEPNEKGPPEHIHLMQKEIFEVISGELTVLIEGERRKLKTGDKTEILKGQRHTYLNETDKKVEAKFGYEPALNIQWMLDTLESNDYKNGGNWNKIPLFETAFVLFHLRKEYRLAKLPFWAQDVLFGTLSKMAQMLGIKKKILLPKI